MTRLEVVALLCVMDRTHSQLVESVPETCGVSHHDKDYESVIQQVCTRNVPRPFLISLLESLSLAGTLLLKRTFWRKQMLRTMHRMTVGLFCMLKEP